jgi:hypothetical protein
MRRPDFEPFWVGTLWGVLLGVVLVAYVLLGIYLHRIG